MTQKLQIICKTCGKLRDFHARGMCQPCYHKWYYKIQNELNQRICIVCGQKKTHYVKGMCNQCYAAARDPKKRREERLNRRHANGYKTMSENKTCSMYLGVHIAEKVLSNVFKNVETMPLNYPGYDFICNHGKKIDVKSSCSRIRKNRSPQWAFNIWKNQSPDYFLCIAFDNRENLNPLHLWLIPSSILNIYNGVSISKTTLSKWNKFELPLNKVTLCCDECRKHYK